MIASKPSTVEHAKCGAPAVGLAVGEVPAMFEAHFGVPLAGCVLNTLNIRLDAATIAFILDHAETDLLITDRMFSPVIREALEMAKAAPTVIDIDDPLDQSGELLGEEARRSRATAQATCAPTTLSSAPPRGTAASSGWHGSASVRTRSPSSQ